METKKDCWRSIPVSTAIVGRLLCEEQIWKKNKTPCTKQISNSKINHLVCLNILIYFILEGNYPCITNKGRSFSTVYMEVFSLSLVTFCRLKMVFFIWHVSYNLSTHLISKYVLISCSVVILHSVYHTVGYQGLEIHLQDDN